MNEGKSRDFRLKVSSRRSAILLIAFLGNLGHGLANKATQSSLISLVPSDAWPLWALSTADWTCRLLAAALAWGVVAFAVSLVFRLRPFPDCLLSGLIGSGVVFVPLAVKFAVGNLRGARSPVPLFVIVVILAFPVCACLSALAGGKVATRLRGGATRIRESAQGV